MARNFKITLSDTDLCSRVKTVMGIPDAFLPDDVISSPDFKNKSEIYINDILAEIQEKPISDNTQDLINMSGIYYICSLLCITMPVRLPNRMENLSTKTLLQTINWDKVSEEMLGRCDDILEQILDDEGIETVLGSTIIELSDETSYPNQYI